MKDWQAPLYGSKTWKRLSSYVRKRDHYLCQDCLKSGKVKAAEAVHHIIEVNERNVNDPSITLNPDNLISLCRECHALRHGARDLRYKVDDFGHVTIK